MKKRILAFILTIAMLVTLSVSVTALSPDYEYTDDGTSITITSYIGTDAVVTIPSTIDGKPVTAIDEGAFMFNFTLTTVNIPDSVTSISPMAFSICFALTAVNVDAANANYSSVDGVLFNKLATTINYFPSGKSGEYVIPAGVTTIGEGAFALASSLTKVTIPDDVTTIGEAAFAYAGIESATISQFVTSIGDGPFAACPLTEILVDVNNANYTSIDGVLFNKLATELIQYPAFAIDETYTVPAGVTSINTASFVGSENLISIIIPDGVTTIGESAFSMCAALESIVIPESVTTIGDEAFLMSDSVIITGVTGSFAEEYANDNGIDFFDPDAPVDPVVPIVPGDPKDPPKVVTDDVPHTGV